MAAHEPMMGHFMGNDISTNFRRYLVNDQLLLALSNASAALNEMFQIQTG